MCASKVLLILYRQYLILGKWWKHFCRIKGQINGCLMALIRTHTEQSAFPLRWVSVIWKVFLGADLHSFTCWPPHTSLFSSLFTAARPSSHSRFDFPNLSLPPSLVYLLGSQKGKGKFLFRSCLHLNKNS